jgi:Ala-tRNA(Pro) deacylase
MPGNASCQLCESCAGGASSLIRIAEYAVSGTMAAVTTGWREAGMPTKQLTDFLDAHHVKYVTIRHSRAYTALETAQSAHVAGKELAKTVIVKVDGRLAMVVLAAPEHIDFAALKRATGAGKIELASEGEFKCLFPDCEVGAMPPFGILYGIEVFVSSTLAADAQIAFNAGSHSELIQLAYGDFARLVNPTILRI